LGKDGRLGKEEAGRGPKEEEEKLPSPPPPNLVPPPNLPPSSAASGEVPGVGLPLATA
jgi:hypothetical protein